jgi:predicted esterase
VTFKPARDAVLLSFVVLIASSLGCKWRRHRVDPATSDPTTDLRAHCEGRTGLPSPLPVCTRASPCADLKHATVDEPEQPPPSCSPKRGKSFQAYDGPPLTWNDPSSGVSTQRACVYRPPGASPSKPRALLVFLHGSGGNADHMYDLTELREKAETSSLSGGSGDPGFFLASAQGRNLHFPHKWFDGPHWDTYFRDFGAESLNPDVRAIDHVIDSVASGGAVDPKRIYIMGWSNGAFFAHAYGIARSVTPTPGHHYVAAVVGFAGGDPFSGIQDGESPSCALATYPRSDVPILDVHRACDSLVACDEAQREKFHLPPGNPVESWLTTYAEKVGHTRPTEILLDQRDQRVTSCMSADECGEVRGLAGHVMWPKDIEPSMLEFLATHPRK